MLPKWHAFFGILYAFVIHILYPDIHIFFIVLIFAASVLIDVDHYLYYVYRKKDLNLRNAFFIPKKSRWGLICSIKDLLKLSSLFEVSFNPLKVDLTAIKVKAEAVKATDNGVDYHSGLSELFEMIRKAN